MNQSYTAIESRIQEAIDAFNTRNNSPLRSGRAPTDEQAVVWALVWIWVVITDKGLVEFQCWNF